MYVKAFSLQTDNQCTDEGAWFRKFLILSDLFDRENKGVLITITEEHRLDIGGSNKLQKLRMTLFPSAVFRCLYSKG